MEAWSSFEATVAKLIELGFVKCEGTKVPMYQFERSEYVAVDVHLYKCMNGYWCVDLNGGWKAPIVWNGVSGPCDHGKEFMVHVQAILDESEFN